MLHVPILVTDIVRVGEVVLLAAVVVTAAHRATAVDALVVIGTCLYAAFTVLATTEVTDTILAATEAVLVPTIAAAIIAIEGTILPVVPCFLFTH